ncbi:MAG: helix-turn-helix domain-containing protein [Armatimonadota bacterium]
MKRRRKELGLSQEALADAADVSRDYLARIEIMRENPTLRIIGQIARALGMETPALLMRPGQQLQTKDQVSALLGNLSEKDAEFLRKEIANWIQFIVQKEKD